MIEFANVTARYPGAKRIAVDDVSFSVNRGQITALAGPNGSGKSTLVRALLGRIPLTGGAIRVDGTDVRTIAPRALARAIAVVTQREDTTFSRPVHEYIALGGYPHAGAWDGRAASDARWIAEAAQRCGVEQLLGRQTDELSGGEWQRVRVARALTQHAGAIVLDEPTTFLDVAHEMAMFELLDSLARGGAAVLLVSHQLNLVARFAQRMVLLHQGRVAAAGTPDAVMRSDVLEPIYEWPLVVTRDPAIDAPALVPLRRPGVSLSSLHT